MVQKYVNLEDRKSWVSYQDRAQFPLSDELFGSLLLEFQLATGRTLQDMSAFCKADMETVESWTKGEDSPLPNLQYAIVHEMHRTTSSEEAYTP